MNYVFGIESFCNSISKLLYFESLIDNFWKYFVNREYYSLRKNLTLENRLWLK